MPLARRYPSFLCPLGAFLFQFHKNGKENKKIKKIIFLFMVLGICCILLPSASADLNDGLIANYPFTFNGNANDETGNGYNGTVYGAILTGDRFGNPSSAYGFDGVDDYIDLGNGLDVPSWENYAISVWFLNDGGGNTSPSFGQKIMDKSYWYLDFALAVVPHLNGHLWFHTYNTPYHEDIIDDSINYRDNEWHHLVVNKEGSSGQMWVDGVLKGTSDNIETVVNSMKLIIGSSEWTHSHQHVFWSGKIDDIRIYNRVLSGDEIRQLYGVYSCVGFAPPLRRDT